MASKKVTTKKSTKNPVAKKAAAKKAATKKAATKKKAPKEKTETKPAAPRHPKARVVAFHKGKEELAKALAASIARDDEDTDVIANRLGKASNMQLLRLQHVVSVVKEKFGSREKLIAAITAAQNKSTDKDYLAKLETFTLPQLLDMATSVQRAAASA